MSRGVLAFRAEGCAVLLQATRSCSSSRCGSACRGSSPFPSRAALSHSLRSACRSPGDVESKGLAGGRSSRRRKPSLSLTKTKRARRLSSKLMSSHKHPGSQHDTVTRRDKHPTLHGPARPSTRHRRGSHTGATNERHTNARNTGDDPTRSSRGARSFKASTSARDTSERQQTPAAHATTSRRRS